MYARRLDIANQIDIEDRFLFDAVLNKQKQYTREMRSSMLACDESDPFSVSSTLKKLSVLQVYHQLMRIIRYTEEMDKLEDKLYAVLDRTIEKMDDGYIDENTSNCLSTLVYLQGKLQTAMIESNKLIEPYLSLNSLDYTDVQYIDNDTSKDDKILDQESRQRLREGAQAALAAIEEESD